MQREMVEEVFKHLKMHDDASQILFSEEKRSPVLMDASSFTKINSETGTLFPPEIAFIDAGNAELLGSANFSLQIIRLGCFSYQGTKLVKQDLKEFFVLLKLQEKNRKLVFHPITFGCTWTFHDIDSLDKTLMQGIHRITPIIAAGRIRNLAELYLIEETKAPFIVRDGDFDMESKEEQEIANQLMQKDFQILGLSKTNTLFTEKGDNAIANLSRISPHGMWSYPLGKNQLGFSSFLVKLHPKSEHIFKVETNKENPHAIFSELTLISKDPIFPGYPYGLITADKMARISNREKETLLLQCLSMAGKEAAMLKPYLSTKDAHEILDQIG